MTKKESDGRQVNRDVHNVQKNFKQLAAELAETTAEVGFPSYSEAKPK